MVRRKKKTKVSSEEEDRISQLPDPLISEILCHLSAKDVVRTSVLSTKWRNFWQWVPELDLDFSAFYTGVPEFLAMGSFVSFAERFFDPHRESWIRKLRLSTNQCSSDLTSYLTRWIDSVCTCRIQHLNVSFASIYRSETPLSIYTCETLVHLQVCDAVLANAEFVSLPCLKIMRLECVSYPNDSTWQKLISGCPVLEDLTIFHYLLNEEYVLQVRSRSLKRVKISGCTLVIDAPLLQCLSTVLYKTKNYKIINSGFFTKLDIDCYYNSTAGHSESSICEILTDISRVRNLVIGSNMWKEIFMYSKSRPVLQFCHLSHVNAKIHIPHLQILPTFLESCPKLESLILELVIDGCMTRKEKKKKTNVMFSTVPRCLVSSLKLVELKRSVSEYEGEIELLRYLLKNSTILEKLKLHVYYKKKAECDFLKQLLTMPRCSSTCEIHCSFIPVKYH